MENSGSEGTPLVDQALVWLNRELQPTVRVERSQRKVPGLSPAAPTEQMDNLIDVVHHSAGTVTYLTEAKRTLSPRDAGLIAAGMTTKLARMANLRLLVVSQWLSEDTRQILSAQGLDYVDLAGNALIRGDNPPIYVRLSGAKHNPRPPSPGVVQLTGARAGRIIRLLADVRPPYGVREVAAATSVAPGYVSRVLDALDRDALIDRSPRGKVEAVDVGRLIRRWAERYDVFKSNGRRAFIAPQGASQLVAQFGALTGAGRIAVTGSFAAVRLAPVAAPTLLVAYADDIDAVSRHFELLPADEGSNVVLLTPYDAAVWERENAEDGINYVAAPQVAVDCLTGVGRMPAEGEAILQWMVESKDRWRWPSLSAAHLASGDA